MTIRFLPLRAPAMGRLRAAWRVRPAWLQEMGAAVLVVAVALSGARPLLGAADFATGSGDWHAHAYRVDELARHGLASWTHEWVGGLPLWSAYQFVPHLIISLAVRLTGAEITRVMTAAQGILLVWLPLSIYILLRRSGVRLPGALAGALLAFVLDTRRQPLANFSELWGLAVAPVLLWAAYRTAGRRAGYAVAGAAGLAIYVHPLAAVAGGIGLVAAAVCGPTSSPDPPLKGRSASRLGLMQQRCFRFPNRNGAGGLGLSAFVKGTGGLGLRAALAVGAAAFFVWPAFGSARPAYEHPYFTSPAFERLLANLATGSFLPGWPLWIGLTAVGTLALARRGAGERRRAARYLLLVGTIVAALALASMRGKGPRPFLDTQLPRLISLVPLLAAAALALALDAVSEAAGGVDRGPRAVRRIAGPLMAGIVVLLAVMAVWRGAGTGPAMATAEPASPFTRWLLAQPGGAMPIEGARIAAPPEIVADASAFAPGRAWYTGSYSGQEWSILAGPLRMFMDGFGAPETRAAYLTAMAVELAVVPDGVRPPITDPRTDDPAAWEEVARLGDIDVLRLPWRAPYAFAAPGDAVAGLDVPDLRFLAVDQSYVRDVFVKHYAALAAGVDAVPAAVDAPSGTTLELSLPAMPPGSTLLLSENWDTAWRAEAGAHRLAVRRAGPNLVAVDLDGVPGDGDGVIRVRLTHGIPRTWWLGGVVTLLTLVAAALAATVRAVPTRSREFH